MNRSLPVLLCAMLPLVALTSCGHTDASAAHGSLSIRGNAVRITVRGAPPASVQSDGNLVIGGRAVTQNAADRALARRYYQDVLAVTAAGKASGEAGAELGGAIVGSIFSALWNDDSSIIKRTANSGAAGLKAHVEALCAGLQALETAQDALAARQPAFTPYRIVSHKAVTGCLKDSTQQVTVTG